MKESIATDRKKKSAKSVPKHNAHSLNYSC